MRKGILVAGNWIIDQVKIIDVYPEEEKLVNIFTEYNSNGGSAYNVLKGLTKLKANFPLSGLGLVGDDERGRQIIEECEALKIDTHQIKKTTAAYTSYTDVMTVKSTGKRTFFHQRGANALLDIDHFDFDISQAKIFHLGYLLLLDKLDIIEEDGNTRASKVLKKAKEQGFITSVDIVSERSDRFKEIIPSSLPYVDYLFVNEFEAGMITVIETVATNGELILDNCYKAAHRIIEMGVKKWVILHFPNGCIAVSKDGEVLFQSSIQLPSDKIEGAVGAGDAFAAGVLMGIHDDWEMEQSLKLGVCVAAASLFAATSSDGILSSEKCLLLADQFGFRNETVKV
ncbi:carbohydrate kinase family protein [Pedobacter cryophilus]|uniref:Carbohydrate kinase family protein n=1 Tax=Pedobacter cryophilus TaxID=2571271 RepID=A0A4U1BW01_9SPHI|nr:carbohydrate kinase family protein [Pedobacter cryophilus]TKB96384.1 carbohydrate kinase family protein [Pedobacter cryophilus]